MGTLIGKGGVVIKSIQDDSGARLNASEEPLPMSTERTVSVQGTPAAVEQAVSRIAKILLDHMDRPSPSLVQYRPIVMHHNSRGGNSSSSSGGVGGGSGGGANYMNMNMRGNAAAAAAAMGYNTMMPMGGMPMNNTSQFYYGGGGGPGGSSSAAMGGYGAMPHSRQQDYGMGIGPMGGMGAMGAMGAMPGMTGSSQAQQIFIPNEMVGCIIGKGGSKINEIRQLSGSHIKIADPHGDTNERLVTVTGSPESNQMALYLLYSRLESEKNRMGLRQ